jgi:aldose 1-epimerase
MRHYYRTALTVAVVALWAVSSEFAPRVAAGQRDTVMRYLAERRGEIVRLEDRAAGIVVSVAPSVGNIAFAMTVRGHEVLAWPYGSLDAFKAEPRMSGIPFLGPWGNRLDEQAFYANGQRFAFDMTLGNVRGTNPIHGFLTFSREWTVMSVDATPTAASLTSRLEFFRHSDWMRQWPFPHTIEMTYRLKDGALEVATTVANVGSTPMPVAIGFHPYFQLTDAPRDEWRISIAARTHWLLTPNKLPTGETEPIEALLPAPQDTSLGGLTLDDVFSDLVRDSQGRATMRVQGRSQRLDVRLGPNYRAAVVWLPAGQPFICLEPMAAITNGLNLAHRGIYKELQSIPPAAQWRESFWIEPSGF